jgi:putative PEP-CTERM system histidine kinase
MGIGSLSTFGTLSYALAAFSFIVLAGLMLASWQGHRRGAALILAVSVSASWSMLLAYQAFSGTLPTLLVYMLEALHDAAWIGALIGIAGASVGRTLKGVSIAACLLTCLVAPALWMLEQSRSVYIDPTLLLSRAQLGSSLIGLILLEQIYRNATHSGRASIKYFIIGVGVIFTYDLFLYSQAELLHALSLEAWNARGVLMVATVPLIALSAQRTRDWSLDVFVSRQVVFYSTTFLMVGAYMSVMALGGYYVKEFGGAWGRVGQVVFFAGAAVALAGLLASGTLRRHAAVFISKHFYRNKYDYRIEWLRFIQTLSSTDDREVRRTAVRAIAQIFASPGGILFLRDDARGDFGLAAAWPMPMESLAHVPSVGARDDLPSFLTRTQWIVDLQELRSSPDVYANISIPQWLLDAKDIRIISPLLQLEEVVGFICLYEPPPPFKLTYEDRDLLKTVGRHVATHIAQDDASRKLSESRQFEAYNRLTAFMMHDLKNSVAQLKLIVENSARHKRNPDFVDDAIATIGNAVERMSRLIEQLRGANTIERVETTNLGALAREAAARCAGRAPRPDVEAEGQLNVRANPERLTSVIEHIIRNAQDATGEAGKITVRVSAAGESAILSVTDTGAGMEADFVRDRLFRPFDSTKGSKGMGIGAYQAREYIRSLGGSVEVRSVPRIGTTFSFTLPCAPAAAAQNGHAAPADLVSRT